MTNQTQNITETVHQKTPLYNWHQAQKARLVPFAGYLMPVQYEGVLAEHNWTRENAGLFDVSHMGQARLTGNWKKLETLVSADLTDLKQGEQKYALLLNDQGGILDDLMISRPYEGDEAFLVVNAAVKDKDFKRIEEKLSGEAGLEVLENQALLALQGPKAHKVIEAFVPEMSDKIFMQCAEAEISGIPVGVSRSGYTGEDGFEISVAADQAEELAEHLVKSEWVKPIGLGARDSLRLEAGLCLYGHDMDETRTPIEAALAWALPKARRERADFPGADRILTQLSEGVKQKRVGLKLKDKAPAREGAQIFSEDGKNEIGRITSGGYAPSLGSAIAMGYVDKAYAKPGQLVHIMLRNQLREAEIVKMPFVPHRFYRG